MIRSVVLWVFCSFIFFNGMAQKKWRDKYYDELTLENFREFKSFNRPIDVKKIDYPLINAAVFYVSNEAGAEYGVKTLEHQENLEILACNHSYYMAKDDFFDHVNPKNKKRKDVSQRASLAGIKNPQISENITAIGGVIFATYLELADAIVDNWIDSPPHRKTLSSTDALELGCGVYYFDGLWQKNRDIHKSGSGFWLATQNFQTFTKVEVKLSKNKRTN